MNRWSKVKRRSLVAAAAMLLVVGVVLLAQWVGGSSLLARSLVQEGADPMLTDDYEREAIKPSSAQMRAIRNFGHVSSSELLSSYDGNVTFSPVSLYYTLAMLAEGSAGDTEQLLLDQLGATDLASLRDASGRFLRYYYQDGSDQSAGKLTLANSLWVNDPSKGSAIDIKEGYLHAIEQAYHTDVHQLDFASSQALDHIERWLRENSHMDDPELPEIQSMTQLLIYSTMDLQAPWTIHFEEEEVQEDAFYLDSETVVTVPYLQRKEWSVFYQTDAFTRASFPTLGQVEVSFILPSERVNPEDLLQTPESVAELISGGNELHGEVTWGIPKFRTRNQLELREMMEGMGLGVLFNEESNLSRLTEGTLFLHSVKQETAFEVNEKGVSASAISSLVLDGEAPITVTADMVLDRPFIYVITIGEEDVPLFIGVCRDPSMT